MIDIDACAIYVFVRQDLPIAEQLVHSCHAVYHMGRQFYSDDGIPSIIVIGVPHEKAMLRVREKLLKHRLYFYEWNDPDAPQLGIVALATPPLSQPERECLANYRLWQPIQVHSGGPANSGTLAAACGGNADPGATSAATLPPKKPPHNSTTFHPAAPVAQLREHLPLKQEVEGENPSGRSTPDGGAA